jgi:hypothetical protein
VQAGRGQEKAHRLEVRRRNGRRKAARTLADRILVLTETDRGNLGGFVAFEAAVVGRATNDDRVQAAWGVESRDWL